MKEFASALRQQSSPVIELSHAPRPNGLWLRFLARLRSWFEIPFGYEDEKGFHYGIEPAPAKPMAQTITPGKVHTDRASDVIPSPCPVSLTDVDTTVEGRTSTPDR